MSALITDKLATNCGSLGNSATTTVVDAAGNLKTSPQFLVNYVVDYAGNLGALSGVGLCDLTGGTFQYLPPAGPWEMQLGTVETVGANLGTISTNYINAGNLTNFTSFGCVGTMAGNISGSGTFSIKNGPQSIGGTSYVGNGLTIFTGTNTCTGILNMESGTKIQLGADCTNATTRWAGNLTIGSGATATQFSSYTTNTFLCQALTNSGTYNVTGCGTCGVGSLGLATTVANNGTINLDKVRWRNQSTWSGSGPVNVLDGATFQFTTNAIPATTTFNINGNGWKDSSCVGQGALEFTASLAIGATVNVQTAATVKITGNITAQLNGKLTGSAPLRITNGLTGATPVGSVNVTSNTSTYSGTVTASNVNLRPSSNGLATAFRIVLENGASFRTQASGTAQNIKSIESLDPTTDWTGDNVTNTLSANGITTFAGQILGGGSGPHNIRVAGGSQNQLTLTGVGSSNSNVTALNGAKVILEGGTMTAGGFGGGVLLAQNGGTISAGKSVTSTAVALNLASGGQFDVHAISPTQAGLLTTTTGQFVLTAGSTTFPINLLHPMDPGTYPVLKVNAGTGVGYGKIPTTGINNTGRTATYAWNTTTKTLMMTLV